MTIQRAFAATAFSAGICAAIGTAVGRALGAYAPGYYRAVLIAGHRPDFDAVDAGTGFGLNAGIFSGIVIGLIIVAIITHFELRSSGSEQRSRG
jgi:hypothetical protein